MPAGFELADLGTVGVLIILEGLLSADNALVLALLVRHLPHDSQKKALLYGLFGAFFLRGLGIFFARHLMGLWWVCAAGALYLVFLAAKHFMKRDAKGDSQLDRNVRGANLGFWPTVALVELTDLVFAVDSILVAVALVSDPSKIWVVYTGGFMGIILLRLAATFFIRLMERFPALDHLAYALVGWAGVKLASAAVDIWSKGHGMHEPHLLPKWAFWVGFGLIVGLGSLYAARHRAPEPGEIERDEADLQCLSGGGFLIGMPPPPGPSRPKSRRYSPPK